jgi:hypothetical protein
VWSINRRYTSWRKLTETNYGGGDRFNEKANAVTTFTARVKSLRREREGFEPPRSALGYFGIAPSTLKVFRVAYFSPIFVAAF